MNGQENESSIVPLYPDANNASPKTGLAGVETVMATQPNNITTTAHHQNQYHHHHHHHHLPPYSSPGGHGHTYTTSGRWLDFIPISTPTITTTTSSSSITNSAARLSHTSPSTNNNGHINNGHHAHSGTNSNGDLQTPTPFYTPNEPSPKFMNSPVFSYSNPDTALYQGPFSPMRASSLYPPPSSPFTNLSLNSPLLPPLSTPGGSGGSGGGSSLNTPTITSMSSSSSSNSCFNMIPSTLLSPAPSQASTNSLSYEDLHEKSLNFFQPAWGIFMAGTKIRFVTGMNCMDWYLVDFLAQSGESLGLNKGEYAPHGLEVRKFIVTSSAKERIQVTFCPVGDPHHPTIEVNCEAGHPFMVEKKGQPTWCAVKPEVFQEIYGTQCQLLECGDICLNISARSPNHANNHSQPQYQTIQHHQQHHQQHPQHSAFPSHINHNGNNNGHQLQQQQQQQQQIQSIKMEPIDEKPVPISVVPQTHHLVMQTASMNSNNSNPAGCPSSNNANNSSNNNNGGLHVSSMNINSSATMNSRKTFASPTSNSPAKKAKESKPKKASNAAGNNNPGENKGRRPMNGFLLFAKDKRPELIQMYPGKDNRSISVLLGEAWQTLDPTEREKYSLNAKVRAEEQKRIHPDCWKRKRSQSINS
ncbi:HMG box-containing protein 1 isoform X2 [Folsomia candida]|nr:HMG box-containing protein 1 isoform X2 [Folsomia candida]